MDLIEKSKSEYLTQIDKKKEKKGIKPPNEDKRKKYI